MSDELLRSLASSAGIEIAWRDQKGRENTVSPTTLRAILTAIGLGCASDEDVRNSLSVVELGQSTSLDSYFLTARVGQAVLLPARMQGSLSVEAELENGSVRALAPLSTEDGLITLPAFEAPGYHRIRLGDAEYTVATAPARAVTIGDLTQDGTRAWGLAAQIYSLRRKGDGGVGDFGAAAALARASARRGADMLALSPVHALFAAEPNHFSPYSPSSRLFYNPLHADPWPLFPDGWREDVMAATGIAPEMARLEALPQVEWPAVSACRMRVLRALYEKLMSPAHAQAPQRLEFDLFVAQASSLLRDHCAFEALHAHHLAHDASLRSWRDWAPALHDPRGNAVREFIATQAHEVAFHLFLQWITARSYAECQRICRESGMRVGLVADIGIGMEGRGSHAWSRQHEVLSHVSIGAPPDYYNSEGQSWGLTGFSPRGLAASGFAPFIETLRAAMRHAGGIRIDHVMGLKRLWLVPEGARATEGAYLNYPSETLFRLVALESWRHKALVIGEDLGTLPDGFREYLREQGIAGLRVLRFERDAAGYRRPEDWDSAAAALTTTHDLVPTAGWWAGSDIEPAGADASPHDQEHAIRAWDRGLLWSAFERAGVAAGERPPPEDTARVVDAAVSFVARTPCQLRLLAIEDALGMHEQPNVPGTTVEKPNWRHRMTGDVERLLDGETAGTRLRMLGAHDVSA